MILNNIKHKPSQITHLCLTSGPGSFTGLRIATTMAKMMNLASNVSIITVNTLDTIAENAFSYMSKSNLYNNLPLQLVTVLDAKRGQFYMAKFEKKSVFFLIKLKVIVKI